MKTIAVIPARYASTRFPAKLMQNLGGKPVIIRTLEACLQANIFEDVLVATDNEHIYNEVVTNGGKAFMSLKNHESGSDRIAEAVTNTDADIIVNVQGDEPFIDKKSLEKALEILRNDTENSIDLVSLMKEITEEATIQNPNNVKVVVDNQNVALYFSRSPIPFNRDKISGVTYYQHIGVYVFRKNALIDFSTWQPTALEQAEKLEQLRYLENGKRIKMVLTKHVGVGIDTPEDLEKAQKMWEDKE